jgi:hypothetical protein
MKPITGIAACCARAVSGQIAAAPPKSEMNSRRLTGYPSSTGSYPTMLTVHAASRQIWITNVRFGSKADIGAGPVMSALPPKADIAECDWQVR